MIFNPFSSDCQSNRGRGTPIGFKNAISALVLFALGVTLALLLYIFELLWHHRFSLTGQLLRVSSEVESEEPLDEEIVEEEKEEEGQERLEDIENVPHILMGIKLPPVVFSLDKRLKSF